MTSLSSLTLNKGGDDIIITHPKTLNKGGDEYH